MLDAAWILYRLNQQGFLIIGVFVSPEAAFRYSAINGPIGQAGWTAPRPGHRYWQCETPLFSYVLEQHMVRTVADPPLDAVLESSAAYY